MVLFILVSMSRCLMILGFGCCGELDFGGILGSCCRLCLRLLFILGFIIRLFLSRSGSNRIGSRISRFRCFGLVSLSLLQMLTLEIGPIEIHNFSMLIPFIFSMNSSVDSQPI